MRFCFIFFFLFFVWMMASVVEDSYLVVYLPIATNATILTTDIGGSHSETNASTAYCANERQIIAICDGFKTNVDTHENRNAGAGPYASIKYAHSAPDDVFIVPNSAYASAPGTQIKADKYEKSINMDK